MLAACGAPQASPVSPARRADATPVEATTAEAQPVPPEATTAAPPVVVEREPECVVGARVELARGSFSHTSGWAAARGRSGFAIAHCADEQHVAVRAFDDALAPFGEAQRLEMPCTGTPQVAAVGERYVVVSDGPCPRARRARCRYYRALDERGTPLARRTVSSHPVRRGQPHAPVASATGLYLSVSEHDREVETETTTVTDRVEVAADGVLRVQHGAHPWRACWWGPCVAADGERVVAMTGDALWRSWARAEVRLASLPPGALHGDVLMLEDSDAWLVYTAVEGETGDVLTPEVARIDVQTGRVTTWSAGVAPTPSRAWPRGVRGGVQWVDLVGRPLGEVVSVDDAWQVDGDARVALVTSQHGGALFGTVIACRSPRSGARERAPSALEARADLGRWQSILVLHEGRVFLGPRAHENVFRFEAPHRIYRTSAQAPSIDHPSQTPWLAVARTSERVWALDASGRVWVKHETQDEARTLDVPGATTLIADARHAYVGTRTGAVFRVPSRLAGPLASDARLEVGGAVVDLQLVGSSLIVATATARGGAAHVVRLEPTPSVAGTIELPEPAVAVDADRDVIVATRTMLHRIDADALRLVSSWSAGLEPHDLAVLDGSAYVVGAGGRVLRHAIAAPDTPRELAPAEDVYVEEGRWLLRGTRGVLYRVGADLTVIVPPR
jgi:hypothetical protein